MLDVGWQLDVDDDVTGVADEVVVMVAGEFSESSHLPIRRGERGDGPLPFLQELSDFGTRNFGQCRH